MNRISAGAVVAVVGATVLGAVRRGDHLAYVKESLTVPLLAAAAIAVLVGLGECVAAVRRGAGAHDGHGHRGWAPAVGWALVVPFVVLGSLPPTPAGAYVAARSSDMVFQGATTPPDGRYPPLPADVTSPITLRDYWMRSHFETDTVRGRRVRLVGFAAADPTPGASSWQLTRMAIVCCAADAFPVRVRLVAAPSPVPASGQWVIVEGEYAEEPTAAPAADEASPASRPPLLRVSSVTPTTQPATPYE